MEKQNEKIGEYSFLTFNYLCYLRRFPFTKIYLKLSINNALKLILKIFKTSF
jgi:hypothetical protein